MNRAIATVTATALFAGGGTLATDAVINPYIEMGDTYILDVQSDIDQGDRLEIAKDRPEATIKKWDDELAVTVKPQFQNSNEVSNAHRPLFSKRMEFSNGKETAFIEPKNDDNTEFDIDFTLSEKPKSNIFTYRIEGAEELDFFYQPALTQEEINARAQRPENVVGSYAVYHKTKANHIEGQTNYQTGKAFHIYRPKATDANGAETWAVLSYESGVLSVTVPQDFLDGAAYPVTVDPTFGYTSIGASQYSQSDQNNSDDYLAGRFTLSENGEITSITAYVRHETYIGRICGYVYTGTGSTPGAQSGASGGQSGDYTAAAWVTSTFASSIAVTSGETWIGTRVCYSSQPMYGFMSYQYHDSSGTGAHKYTTWVSDSNKYSFYATYTASGGGGGTTPQQSQDLQINNGGIRINNGGLIIN